MNVTQEIEEWITKYGNTRDALNVAIPRLKLAERNIGGRAQLWIVGRVTELGDWQFQGVFDTEEAAVAACKDETWFVGPVALNEELPEEAMDWPGAYFPIVHLK